MLGVKIVRLIETLNQTILDLLASTLPGSEREVIHERILEIELLA